MENQYLELPKCLDFSDKIVPMVTKFDYYRYFLGEGGRGGSKSQSVARFLLYLGDRYNLRIVCGREVQNSIAESVYSLICDVIETDKLPYQIFATKIVHRTNGTVFTFRGFREIGKFNIQGMEAVDILWVDEAQSLTKAVMDVLIPTIRKDSARIFFTMNRHVHDDPAYVFCQDRKDCLHIHLNYFDNKHCTMALKVEAEECKKKSLQDYNHIWLGIPLEQSEDQVFGHDELQSCTKIDFAMREGYGLSICGFDIARFGDDKSSAVKITQMGALQWEVSYVHQWDKQPIDFTTGRINDICYSEGVDKAIIDEDGIGGAGLDFLIHRREPDYFVGFRNPPLNVKDDKFYGNNRTKNVYKLKDMIRKGHIRITDKELLSELEHCFRYRYDNYQRKILIAKDVMKTKHNVKSPNLADGLIMAVSLIGEINYSQERRFSSQPAYAKEENLLAGVR